MAMNENRLVLPKGTTSKIGCPISENCPNTSNCDLTRCEGLSLSGNALDDEIVIIEPFVGKLELDTVTKKHSHIKASEIKI